MKTKLAIWLLVMLSFTRANAQNDLPPAYEISELKVITLEGEGSEFIISIML